MKKDLIIIGAGGHAKVVLEIALANGFAVRGFLDDYATFTELMGYPCLGSVDQCVQYTDFSFVIAIGNNAARRTISEKYPQLSYATLIHPSAVLASSVQIGKGTVVMPGAVINACAKVGKFCVINSCSVVEHDCIIGDYTLLAPHSTVCGAVKIGKECWIGAGATIIQTKTVCDNVVLGAGAVTVNNIAESGTYVGVPAKRIQTGSRCNII